MSDTRAQFAFWLRSELGDRFRAYCARAGRYQREVVEEAIEYFLSARSAEPKPAAVLTTFPAPDSDRGLDSRDGRK